MRRNKNTNIILTILNVFTLHRICIANNSTKSTPGAVLKETGPVLKETGSSFWSVECSETKKTNKLAILYVFTVHQTSVSTQGAVLRETGPVLK